MACSSIRNARITLRDGTTTGAHTTKSRRGTKSVNECPAGVLARGWDANPPRHSPGTPVAARTPPPNRHDQAGPKWPDEDQMAGRCVLTLAPAPAAPPPHRAPTAHTPRAHSARDDTGRPPAVGTHTTRTQNQQPSDDALLPGAGHAQDATIRARHGALAVLEVLGLLAAGGLDAGKLLRAVRLAADRRARLLGVVVGNQAATCVHIHGSHKRRHPE
jgi:hypothetical protein